MLRRTGLGVLSVALLAGAAVVAALAADSKPAASSGDAAAKAALKLMENPPGGQPSCFTCHTIGKKGAVVAFEPSLDQVGNHRDPEWLRAWLKGPAMMKKNTVMPKYPYSEKQIDILVAYLSSLKKPVDAPAILAAAKSKEEAGAALFKAHDCFACHMVKKVGRTPGGDLSKIGSKSTEKQIAAVLSSPAIVKPDGFMPKFKLSEPEVAALTAYLLTLK
jgi:mono/diheme cytochrome c family protein